MMQTKGNYLRFILMILTSMVVMYGITYLNSYDSSHIYWSETRFYMTLLMGASMGVIMLSFMLRMYGNKKANAGIYLSSGIVFLVALWLVRSQIIVGDTTYMKGMIPHHSIAILTSERAQIQDRRVQELAKEIIAAQRREIKEMEWLIEDIKLNGVAGSFEEAEARQIPSLEGDN